MSSGIACKCAERKKPIGERLWECWQYKCNFSAFNGYKRTPSDYSLVHCTVCGGLWRTKAAWAGQIPQGDGAAKKRAEGPTPEK